jgi:hypothetical protein
VRHNFTFDAGYDIPFRSFFENGPRWLVEGWQLNAIYQARSGLPVNVTQTGGIFGGFSQRPNVVAGVNPYCSNYSVPTCQFNAAAFQVTAPGVFGNAGRNILRGPKFSQLDASIFKNTRLTERTSLQLRLKFSICSISPTTPTRQAVYRAPVRSEPVQPSASALRRSAISSAACSDLADLDRFSFPRDLISKRFFTRNF